MPYTLRALVARRDIFAPTPPWIADSAVIGLPQGFAMVPLTQALRWQFGPADRPWLYAADARFYHLPDALVPHVEALSRGGRVAYLEAEFHGGDGEQRSMVWEDGAPRGAPDEGSYAINTALASLGVEPAEGADRFDTLGLGRHRSAEEWAESVRTPVVPPVPPSAPSSQAEPPPATPRRGWRFWR
jgi:hypothetical protein